MIAEIMILCWRIISHLCRFNVTTIGNWDAVDGCLQGKLDEISEGMRNGFFRSLYPSLMQMVFQSFPKTGQTFTLAE